MLGVAPETGDGNQVMCVFPKLVDKILVYGKPL